MTKSIIILGALLLVVALVGCTGSQDIVLKENGRIVDVNQINSQYETVGEIITFEENAVHVITGDTVQIFNVDGESIKNFYLGETVGVKKIDEDRYEIEKYKANDFDKRYTNMGELISTIIGKVKEVKNNKFIISTEEGDLEFESYQDELLEKESEVTVDYLEREEGNVLINFYNEKSKINLTVMEIRRGENTGIMILDTEDRNGMKYMVYVLGSTTLNFHHSDLKENDKITVYSEIIIETYPAQIDAKMIKKL